MLPGRPGSAKRVISSIAYTPAVKAAQEQRGSRRAYAKMEERGEQRPWQDTVTAELAEFVAQRDSLYLGTANANGQPYVQHRGGPKGFLKVLDEHTLALADFGGNAQYISIGNLSENNKAFMFLMDYPNRHRIKIWGTAEFVEGDAELLQRVTDPGYAAEPERVLRFHVHAWSPNCNLHITQRFTVEEIAPYIEKYQRCVAELEAINASLRNQLREAGVRPAGGELATAVPALDSARSSDDGGCAPRELLTQDTV
jgi:predicted pyridoxine 5'-phosphate oxidase superfamily flavin-nucleotide-binding protein